MSDDIVVGVLLGCLLRWGDEVAKGRVGWEMDETTLGDSDGKLLGWVDGEVAGSMLTLGSKLGSVEGFIDRDGSKLKVLDGINVGKLLGPSVGICEGVEVGIRLTLGLVLGAEEGSTEIDGFIDEVLDGSTVCVAISLGFLLGDTDSLGTILGLRDGPPDTDINSLGSIVGVIITVGC